MTKNLLFLSLILCVTPSLRPADEPTLNPQQRKAPSLKFLAAQASFPQNLETTSKDFATYTSEDLQKYRNDVAMLTHLLQENGNDINRTLIQAMAKDLKFLEEIIRKEYVVKKSSQMDWANFFYR